MENGNEPLPYYMQGLLLPWSWKKKESCKAEAMAWAASCGA